MAKQEMKDKMANCQCGDAVHDPGKMAKMMGRKQVGAKPSGKMMMKGGK